MRKKGFLKKRAEDNEEMGLNITAMADIFTIILVFLLKSYATSAVNLSPTKGLLLPSALAESNLVEALKVQITETTVLVEETVASNLTGFKFQRGDVLKNGSSQSLSETIKKERQRQLAIAKVNSDVKVDAKIIVVADQRAPYKTIKTVLASAALNGFTDFKLAVVRPE